MGGDMLIERQWDILHDVYRERQRQDQLKREGRFAHTCADRDLTEHFKLAVLAEEFGEVAHSVCDGAQDLTREELIQVAAVCLAWIEGLQ